MGDRTGSVRVSVPLDTCPEIAEVLRAYAKNRWGQVLVRLAAAGLQATRIRTPPARDNGQATPAREGAPDGTSETAGNERPGQAAVSLLKSRLANALDVD